MGFTKTTLNNATAAPLLTPEDMDKKRIIFLNDNVNDAVVENITMRIFKYNEEDDESEKTQKEFDRADNPIRIYINSYGGTVYDALSVVSAIQSSATPVQTIALGKAMSAGFMILQAGHQRFCQKHSTLMYHQVAGWAVGKLGEVTQEVKEMQRLQDVIDDLVLERSRVDKEKLDKVNEQRAEWYIDSDTALKYGFVDEVI